MSAGTAPPPGYAGGEPGVRLAVLDMAGTTVSDDGVVLAAFSGALGAAGWSPGRIADEATDRLVASMGRSKQEVFTELLGGDAARGARGDRGIRGALRACRRCGQGQRVAGVRGGARQAPGRRHPDLPHHRFRPPHEGRHHPLAWVDLDRRPRALSRRRRTGPSLARHGAHRPHAPRDRRRSPRRSCRGHGPRPPGRLACRRQRRRRCPDGSPRPRSSWQRPPTRTCSSRSPSCRRY